MDLSNITRSKIPRCSIEVCTKEQMTAYNYSQRYYHFYRNHGLDTFMDAVKQSLPDMKGRDTVLALIKKNIASYSQRGWICCSHREVGELFPY